MDNKVRLQHYVPKVYLKNFSDFNGKEHYIWVFDKKTQKIFQTNIKDIAFEEEFYNKWDEDQKVEQKMREIETEFGKAVEKLIQVKDLNKITPMEKRHISKFIASQMIRTKESRVELEELPKALLERFGDNISDKLKMELESSLEKDSLRKLHGEMILENFSYYENILNQMKWILISNKSKSPFWSSDNPVVMFNSIDHSPYGNLGLTSLGIEVCFPINPKLWLIICDPVSFQLEPSKKSTKDYHHIVRERDLQVRDSTRFIFSNEDNFDFAKIMLKENPLLKDPNRKRLNIK